MRLEDKIKLQLSLFYSCSLNLKEYLDEYKDNDRRIKKIYQQQELYHRLILSIIENLNKKIKELKGTDNMNKYIEVEELKKKIKEVEKRNVNILGNSRKYNFYIEDKKLICEYLAERQKHNIAPADKILDFKIIKDKEYNYFKFWVTVDTKDVKELENSFCWCCCPLYGFES